MQRLEAKAIHGRTYYYLSQWGWKNGKCRRLSQKYLGKPEDIAQALAGAGPTPEYALVLDWGLPQALWREAERAQILDHVNRLCPKRAQGLSTGDSGGAGEVSALAQSAGGGHLGRNQTDAHLRQRQ